MKPVLIFLTIPLWLAAWTQPGSDDIRAQAERLAYDIIIIDGHVDLPYRLNHTVDDISERTESGDFDYPRARKGGLDALFTAVFTPPSMESTGQSKPLADDLISTVEAITRVSPDKFALAVSPGDVEKNFRAGVISLCLGMENGSPIEGDLDNLQHFYDRGVRLITLAHGADNHICDSSYDTTRTWRGLSDFGRDVVAEMNRLGIMIDVSHVSDDAFYQIVELSRAPIIASHSACRRFLPGFERNMSDEMIELLAEKGGIILMNFGSTFVRQEAREWSEQFWKDRAEYLEANHVRPGSEEARQYRSRYVEDKPFPRAGVGDVADHIDHVVSLVGVDHVGLGSDFDGLGDTLPAGLEDVSKYPNLILELLERGYSDQDIRKIASENILRLWREVEQAAVAE